ncbi:aldo/keto reductase [Paenibacillus eucommiae]|uniref:Aryl-alcohol dehydrogenase-like predicted oxidoreductase n=1 Tax=Paenibacillus eucommiae TaxID=1355755 RepID=A0ABS4J2H2_9BACL|nr:aldo/keto reductase [Paenibacillus eucommiae]MBP1994022.1 aryl-alcohol dehydrogenase-like predicted oxidoreductase [Paenibacillus eucommiae]
MQYTQVKDLTFSKLTLGTVQLGTPYGIANKMGQPDESTRSSILEAALEGGINCFDTANRYGTSELVLGEFFANREKPLIVTKMRLDVDKSTEAAEVERLMLEYTEMSLSRLGISQIPIMMLHNPDILAFHGETFTAVSKRLKQEGLVAKMGMSMGANSEEQFRDLWPIIKDDIYEAVQIPINILDHRLLHTGGMGLLEESGKIVFARSIFLQGLLFLKDDELPPHLKEAAKPLQTLRALAEQEGVSIAQLAVSFIAGLPQIHSLLFGAETAEQVRENISLFNSPAISEKTHAAILKELADVPESVINTVLWART